MRWEVRSLPLRDSANIAKRPQLLQRIGCRSNSYRLNNELAASSQEGTINKNALIRTNVLVMRRLHHNSNSISPSSTEVVNIRKILSEYRKIKKYCQDWILMETQYHRCGLCDQKVAIPYHEKPYQNSK